MTYNIDVEDTHWPKQKGVFSKNMKTFMSTQATLDEQCQMHVNDIRYQEICEHNAQLYIQTKNVTVKIISPLMTISWFYMLPSWRQLLDFNFKRPSNWNNDSPVNRFNDCEYVQKHHVYDWHSFALLEDNVMIHSGLLVQHADEEILYVHDVEYHIPNDLLHAQNRQVFIKAGKNQEDYKPLTLLKYQKIHQRAQNWVLDEEIHYMLIEADSDLTVIDHHKIKLPIVKHDGVKFEIINQTQHIDVQNDKPFLFITLGFDKYHHTTFTGKHNWDTHGIYWWVANMNPHMQYTQQLTMVMGQVPNCVKLNTIGRITWEHWNPLLQHGIKLWNGNKFVTVYGMIANQITDMEDGDHFRRRRRNNTHSNSDAMLWAGWQQGCKWPDNVSNLMQLGIIMPGPYMLKLWQHVNHNLLGKPGFWEQFPSVYAKSISMTTNNFDIYNELGIDSTLKSTIELNHTTVLGCTKDILAIEWKHLHLTNNFDEVHTRTLMRAYLQQYFDGVNGCVSMLVDFKTKLNLFNAMHHAWQKLIECMICLPTVLDWYGNFNCVVALIRVTGAMYNANTHNNINNLQDIIKPILAAS